MSTAPADVPPPAVVTMYCLPSLPMKVIGAEWALASSSVSQSNLPVLISNARDATIIGRPDEDHAAGSGDVAAEVARPDPCPCRPRLPSRRAARSRTTLPVLTLNAVS